VTPWDGAPSSLPARKGSVFGGIVGGEVRRCYLQRALVLLSAGVVRSGRRRDAGRVLGPVQTLRVGHAPPDPRG